MSMPRSVDEIVRGGTVRADIHDENVHEVSVRDEKRKP
jgi:hypothetical protein